jgi:aldose 1-epimerase
MTITRKEFGRLPDGTAVHLYTLDNENGLRISVSTYGGIITSVQTPDRNGTMGEVTLAFDTLEEYLAGHPFYGSFVGRVANRISGGGFEIDGTRYELVNNQGTVHLHGGTGGFHTRVYEAETEERQDAVLLHLSRISPDGEEGYPGALSVRHTIGVTADNRLTMEFAAETDAPTVVNLTNHTYWNLGEPTILDHEVQINADQFVEIENLIPTGNTPSVEGTPLDFRTFKTIRRDFDDVLKMDINGFDHSLVVRGWTPGNSVTREVARVRSHATGREMVISSTYRDVQFYSGNNLPGEKGRDGSVQSGQEALCLECQFSPDSPNRPEFPSITLRPNERYHQVTEHQFRTFTA